MKLTRVLPALALASCEPQPEQLPPFAEVRVVIDTDLDVEQFVARLQIDLYDEREQWFFSRELGQADADAWPVSFVVVGPKATDEGADTKTVLVRLRLYPDGKIRDYRGERFFEPGSLEDDTSCHPLLPANYGVREQKELVELADDGTLLPPISPPNEPIPELTIDRFVAIPVVPGELAEVRVTLSGSCLGVQASFGESEAPGDEQSCLGDERTLEVQGLAALRAPSESAALSLAGSYPPAEPCNATPILGEFQSFEDEVCVDGGLFFLGDPAVFGYGVFDAAPERAVVMSPFLIDRFEVTVGRFRKALDGGLLGDVEPPIVNDGPLLYHSGDPATECTFSEGPTGRDDYPLNCVSWETARTFCQSKGGDLPSEAQWEWVAAAAGRKGRETRYAWGSEEPTCERAVYGRAADLTLGALDCAVDPADVGVQPLRENEAASGDRSPTGVVGLAGNLRELTLDVHRPYCTRCWVDGEHRDPLCETDVTSYSLTARGGDWASSEDALLVGLRDQALDPIQTSPRIGFRCVRLVGDQ